MTSCDLKKLREELNGLRTADKSDVVKILKAVDKLSKNLLLTRPQEAKDLMADYFGVVFGLLKIENMEIVERARILLGNYMMDGPQQFIETHHAALAEGMRDFSPIGKGAIVFLIDRVLQFDCVFENYGNLISTILELLFNDNPDSMMVAQKFIRDHLKLNDGSIFKRRLGMKVMSEVLNGEAITSASNSILLFELLFDKVEETDDEQANKMFWKLSVKTPYLTKLVEVSFAKRNTDLLAKVVNHWTERFDSADELGRIKKANVLIGIASTISHLKIADRGNNQSLIENVIEFLQNLKMVKEDELDEDMVEFLEHNS